MFQWLFSTDTYPLTKIARTLTHCILYIRAYLSFTHCWDDDNRPARQQKKNQTHQNWTAWLLMPKFKISALHNLKACVIFGNTLHSAVQWRENEKKKPYRLVLTKSRHLGGWQLKEKFTLEPNYSDLLVLISPFFTQFSIYATKLPTSCNKKQYFWFNSYAKPFFFLSWLVSPYFAPSRSVVHLDSTPQL